MMLHLFDLAKRINPDGTPFISEGWCVSLQPLLVLFGSIPRFALNEFRYEGKDKESMSSTWIAFGLACYAAASAIFVLTTYTVVHLALTYDGPDRAPNTTAYDKDVLVGLLLAQIGYPVLTYFSLFYLHVLYKPDPELHRASASYPATLSFIKDVGYSILDVLTKAGMAFWTFYRLTML